MKEINIEKADGTIVPLNSKNPVRAVKSAVVKDELMGEDTVTLTVESAEPIDFAVGDKLEVLGRAYFLNSPPKVQRTGRRYLTYTVVVESAKYDLSKVVMVNEFAGGKETVNETEFNYTGEFARLMDLLVSNMCRVYGKGSWTWKAVNTGADSAFDPDYGQCKTLSFSSENVLSALNTVCGEWDAEFRIDTENGSNVIEVGRVGRNVHQYVFAYGRENGLYTLTRDRNAEVPLVTRLYAYGDSGNLGNKYRDGRRRLALPLEHLSPLVREGLYVQDDALVERFGLSEGAIVFDEIFPSRRGTVTAVDGADELKFTDSDMFDLNEKDGKGDSKYILGSAAPTVRFNTGNLGGYEFSLAGYNSLTKMFTLVPFTDENDYRYPSKDDKAFRIGVGDTYALLNIALPDSYVSQAEGELAERALEKYGQIYKKLYSYALEMDPLFVKEHFPNAVYAPAFRAGDYVNIKDEDLIDIAGEGLGEHTVAVKIASVSVDLYNPFGYTLGLSDSAPSSVVTRIVKSEKDTQKIIKINDLSDPARARRNLRTTADLLEMTFDTDGYFVDGRLRPETVETKMIAVGALSQQFLLDGLIFTPNLNGDASSVGFSEGVLTHMGLDRAENKIWSLLPGQVSGLMDDTAYYIYARCQKEGSAGTMVLSADALRYDADADFYHFSVGVLSTVQDGFRRISLTYGISTVNGREITTGRISAAGGKAYFDLDKGEIGGRIVFSSDAVFRDEKGVEGTLITKGKINTGLIDADTVVATAASIANFKIQDNLLQGIDSHIVFQNENIEALADLMSPKEGQQIDVSGAFGAGRFNNSTVTDIVRSSVTAAQDFTVEYPGILKFSIATGRDDTFQYVEEGIPAFIPVEGEPSEYKCEVLRKTGANTYDTIDTFRPPTAGTIETPVHFDRNVYLPLGGDYRIRFVWESANRVYWIDRPQDWPDDVFPILTTELSVAIVGQSPGDRGHIYYAGSSALTKIGTDGLYSFWSLYNYLYFSQSEGLKIKAGTTISSPNGEYSLTVNDKGISISGPTGTNASNNTVDFTVAGTRVNITTGEKLSAALGKIAKWFTDLKTVAFTGSYNDLSNKPMSLPANGGHADSATKDASGNVITETYATKADISSVYKFKGSVQNVAALLALTGVRRGDVYDVRESGTLNSKPVNSGDNLAATADNPSAAQWDNLAGKFDTSNFLPKAGDASDTTVAFVPESGELTSGAQQKNLWGRVAKKIADIVSGAIKVAKAAAADIATNAVNDENGNNIPKTYAKKSEVTAVKVGGRNYITGLRDNWEGGLVNSNGTITTGNNYNQVTKDYQDIAFLAGKTAIASVNPDDVITGSERLKQAFRIAFYTLDYLFISFESSDYNIAYKTFTVPENAAWCKVSVGVGVYGYVSGNFDKIRFQLELGNKETDYSPAPQDIPCTTGEYPGMKVGQAAKATNADNADKVDGLHAAAAGTVEGGKLASYDAAGRLKGTVVEAAKYLKVAQGEGTGLAFNYDIGISGYTKHPLYGMIMGNPTDIGLTGYGDVTSDLSFNFTMSGYNDDTHKHRGWVFLNPLNNTYAASLSQRGYAKFAGEVTAPNFRGTADKAMADGNGNNIPATYYKKTGDVMTGTMKQKKQNSVILSDQASMYIPSGHKGWIALDFGLDSVTVMGEIYLYKYGWGGIVIDFSGYTYVGTGGANNWHVPRYGVRGSTGGMPEIVFAKDNATSHRYILVGGDDFVWGGYDYIALTRVVLGSISNDTRDRTWAFSALTGTLAALGMTAVWTGGPSYCIEVDKARTANKATQADQDGGGLNIRNNYLQRTYNRPGATWSGAGWRRIYIAGNADNPGGTALLNIATLYWNTPSQLLSLLISVGPRDVILQQLNGCYNVPISKVRVCRKSNAVWCVDVYCNDARNNSIYANQCGGDGYIVDTEMLNPSVDGYTVNEFDIKAGDRTAQKSEVDACLGKAFTYGVNIDPNTQRNNGGFHASGANVPPGFGWAIVYTMKCSWTGAIQIASQVNSGTDTKRRLAYRSTLSEGNGTWTDWREIVPKDELPGVYLSRPATPKDGDIVVTVTD